jgi:hypothetical protein
MVDHLLTDLYGPLKIATVYTTLRKERYMKIAMQIYRRMFGNRQAVRFDQFVVACHKLLPELADGAREHGDADDPLEEFLRIFHQSCDAYLAGHSPTLISPEFAAFLHKMKDDDLYLTSPDLLVMFDSGAKGGATAPTFVLGELHHGITMEGWMLSFHSDADRVREEIRQEIVRHLAIVQERSKRKILPANLIFNRKMKTAPQEYPGVMVEVSGYASTRRPDATFGLKDLVVRVDGDELVLTLRGDDRAIRFYPPAFGFTEQAYVPFALFSFPIVQMPTYRREGFTPRIETGAPGRAAGAVDAFDGRPADGNPGKRAVFRLRRRAKGQTPIFAAPPCVSPRALRTETGLPRSGKSVRGGIAAASRGQKRDGHIQRDAAGPRPVVAARSARHLLFGTAHTADEELNR